MSKFTAEWFKAAAIRAIRTFAQSALSLITVGAAFTEIDWLYVASVSFVSLIYSILTSIATELPEASTDGVLMVDESGEKAKWLFQVNTPVEEITKKTSIRLRVDPTAVLSKDEKDDAE